MGKLERHLDLDVVARVIIGAPPAKSQGPTMKHQSLPRKAEKYRGAIRNATKRKPNKPTRAKLRAITRRANARTRTIQTEA